MGVVSRLFAAEPNLLDCSNGNPHPPGGSPRRHSAAWGKAADARLIVRLDALLVAMHAAGRRALSMLDTDVGRSDVLAALLTRAPAIGFTIVDVVALRKMCDPDARDFLTIQASRHPAVRLSLVALDDLQRLPFDEEEFDVVLLTDNASRKMVKECERVTCRGGVLVPRY